jgi:hypothetical protein
MMSATKLLHPSTTTSSVTNTENKILVIAIKLYEHLVKNVNYMSSVSNPKHYEMSRHYDIHKK